MQLVNARENTETLISIAFDEKEVKLLEKVNAKFEGKTEKQKNPHPKDKLAFASWVIARLGGWKGYQKGRPPGPITMLNGLMRFQHYLEAADLLQMSFNDT
jgi:hypothetical protein